MSVTFVPLSCGGGHRLAPDAAMAFERVKPCVEALMGGPWVPTDTARPIEVQERIFLDRYWPCASGFPDWAHPSRDARTWRGVRYVRRKGTAMAAVPGTSKHGRGLAVDCGRPWNSWSAPRRAEFERVMREHGWVFPISSEPWHAEWSSRLDQHRGKPVAAWQSVQSALAGAGHKITVDGLAGAQTLAAVEAFQAARGLTVDGIPGPATRAALGIDALPDGATVRDLEAQVSQLDRIEQEIGKIKVAVGRIADQWPLLLDKTLKTNAAVGRAESAHGPGLANLADEADGADLEAEADGAANEEVRK